MQWIGHTAVTKDIIDLSKADRKSQTSFLTDDLGGCKSLTTKTPTLTNVLITPSRPGAVSGPQ
jgi:hypothetical protein